ncbi:uncharacterized protein LOC135494651 [Lineus longissimus]|uniref:uncharacterized protein LOC135494651 n=1 Tax=Lineus longissimus TaxID=88925 RepID=UPI00315CFE2E
MQKVVVARKEDESIAGEDPDEMIQASAMRSKKYRDWHYKDLEAKCTRNIHCIHTGFCDEAKGKCCAPHGYACISRENCCSEKHVCGGRYAKSCINPPPPN